MSDSLNVTPGMWAAGSFTAKSPFNVIVDPDTYFTVEATRTVSEMQSRKFDFYKEVFQPAGISKDKTTELLDELLKDKACIVALTRRTGPTVYVPTTYLETSPLVDGVVFEHLCVIADCGSCSPDTKTKVDSTLQAIEYILQKNLGIENPKVQVATVPQKSYVSKVQAEAWEQSRQLRIDATANPVVQNELLTKENAELRAYITKLETAVKEKS